MHVRWHVSPVDRQNNIATITKLKVYKNYILCVINYIRKVNQTRAYQASYMGANPTGHSMKRRMVMI